MTPAARMQAAIELLDEIIEAARGAGAAADTIVARYFKSRRYAGSKDRRAVRELVYRVIRRSGERPSSGRAAMLGLAEDDRDLRILFDGGPHAPAAREADEEIAAAGIAPEWLDGRFDPLLGESEIKALLARAPLDIRVNRLKASVEQARSVIPDAEPCRLSPFGLRLPDGFPIQETEAWKDGLVEVQDEGSQLLSLACGAAPGAVVIDLCAGAGGKTLALAAEMANEGRLVACDVDRGRLSKMPPRLTRAAVSIVEPRLLDPGKELESLSDALGLADVVLVDAPCSGTGTWRRNPETRWRLDERRLERLTELQARLLDIAAAFVRPGGTLVYAVCSLLADEGQRQANAFCGRRSAFVSDSASISWGRESGSGRLLTPAHDGTDGFFVARWRAPC
jgi:16S rRNA (cytosine967-C5)-methyltransferase